MPKRPRRKTLAEKKAEGTKKPISKHEQRRLERVKKNKGKS